MPPLALSEISFFSIVFLYKIFKFHRSFGRDFKILTQLNAPLLNLHRDSF
ncbi:hypothetical protein CAMGR0001_0824 [Campylobacter gracilis RM3268]|uniref:Uncharacterized protein n=1 Tax=Campylobacter gracilis RM3268 TaxID=553220 RepID=C8PG31_9BACT|nr:hypothetical protein CAMGR0001_0824 [Campylobacter gracilis RM3268]